MTLPFLASGLVVGCFDSTVPPDYYPGLDDNSPPPDPSTYAVNGDVSGTLGNVTVNAIGGLTAAQIAQGLGTISTATDLNQASTLVARDSSGSFAANVVTAAQFVGNLNGSSISSLSAEWAAGRLGADITSVGSALNLNGGSVFRVTATGNLTQSSMPTSLAAGTTVRLIFAGPAVTVVHAAATASFPGLLLRGGGTFRTAANGNESLTLVFVSGLPQGNWIEVDRHMLPSEVIARGTLGQAIPDNTEQTVFFDSEDRDSRNEFSASTFIPSSAGTTYHFSTQVTTDPLVWSAGDFCRVRVIVAGTPVYTAVQFPADGQTQRCSVPLSGLLRLGLGQTVNVTVTIARAGGSTLAADGTANFFTLNRIDQP
jgi:hypothetical protein